MIKCTSTYGINRRGCFLVHGFNVRDDGKGTTDCLGTTLKRNSFNPVQFDYGWIGLLGARVFSHNIAKILASISQEDDIAIGHSNGCNIINQALNYGAKFKRVLYISPALDKRTVLHPNVERVIVLHTRKDWIVQLAALLPFHPWGNMGRVGYQGTDKRYENIDWSNWCT